MNRLKLYKSAFMFLSLGLYVIIAILFIFILPALITHNYSLYLAGSLVIAGLGLGYSIARTKGSYLVTILGSIAISVLVAFPLFFTIIFAGWTVAVSFQ